jgi:hypothetical protein
MITNDVIGLAGDWFAVVVATLAYFVLGALWFTPLFGKAWDVAVGFDRPKGHRFGAIYYVTPLVSSLIVSIATDALIRALDLVADAVAFGVLVGIGYAAAVSVNNAVTPNTPRPLLFGTGTGGYHVVGIVLVSVIITKLG